MTFIEAIEAIKEGKKIRLPHWPQGDYLDHYKLFNECRIDTSLTQMFTDNWEIFE